MNFVHIPTHPYNNKTIKSITITSSIAMCNGKATIRVNYIQFKHMHINCLDPLFCLLSLYLYTMSQEPQSYQLHAPVESREEILFECVQLFFTNPLPSKTNLPVYHTITNPLVVKLMEGYVNHFSKWLDIPFFLPFFEKVLPVASLSDETGIIISAISTCGAVYLHKSDPSRYSHNSALTYLNSTIAMLKDELGKPDRRLHRCLIASILLNISEVNLDPTYSIQHISHLRGSMNILDEIKKTHSLYASTSDAAPFDSQITRYCFWPLVFSDLFFALMNSSVTRLNPIM